MGDKTINRKKSANKNITPTNNQDITTTNQFLSIEEKQVYYKNKYKKFFNYLNKKNIEYIFTEQTIDIKNIALKKIILRNIELPPNVSFSFIPEKFNFKKQINLINYPAKSLPNIFIDDNYLIISKSPELQELPDNFKLDGSLIIKESGIKRLGKNIYIKNNLSLEKSQLEEIGDNLIVGNDLYLSSSSICYIGKNIYVGNDFYANKSNLKELSDNLYVVGSLDISTTEIKEINQTIYIGKDLNWEYGLGEKLPDNLVVNNLIIDNSNIKKIGRNTIIKNSLHACNSQLKSITNDIIINNNCYIRNTKIKELPDNFYLKGDLMIDNSNIKKLGKNTIIEGSLSASNCLLKTLPNDIIIHGTCNISNTKIKKLPDSLLKNNKQIIIYGLLIENVDKFYHIFNHKIYFFINMEIKNYFNKRDEQLLAQEIHEEDETKIELYIKNTLLYNRNTELQKKLLLEQFDKITPKEINQYINNKNSQILQKENNYQERLIDNKSIKSSSTTTNNIINNTNTNNNVGITTNNMNNINIKFDALKKNNPNIIAHSIKQKYEEIIKGKIAFIHYCRSKQAIEFLYQNNYLFTQEEMQTIKNKNIKNIYEMYLLKSTYRIN